MTDAKKFLFDTNDFNRTLPNAELPIYTEEQLTLAKTQSFASGKAEGVKESHQRLIDLVQKMLEISNRLAQDEERREVEKCADVAKMVMQVVRKLMPKFAHQYALPEIEHAILQAIEVRREEPRIAVTVPTMHLSALKTKMDTLALEKGYAGKVILVADDSQPPTNCRVEWADGGAERLYERLYAQIEAEFSKAIATMNASLDQDKKQ